MTRQQIPAACGFTAGAALVTAGVAAWSTSAALVVAGILVATLTWLLLLDVGSGR